MLFYSALFLEAFEKKENLHREFICPENQKWIEMDIYPAEEGISVFFKDIDKRKRTEEELQRLSLIARDTENAVLMVNPDRKTTWVNAAFTRMTGYAFEEVIGKTPATLLEGPDTDPAMEQIILDNYQKKEPFQFEVMNY